MSLETNHEEIQALLPGAALEILDAGELEMVKSHVLTCGGCSELLENYRDVVASLTLGLPSHPIDAGRSGRLRARLLSRAGLVRTSRRSSMIGRYGGWAVAAGLAGVLLIHHGFHRPIAYGWVLAGVFAVVSVALGVYGRIQRDRLTALQDHLAEHEQIKAQGREQLRR